MSVNNQHIVYDHPSKTFIGVRFVLLGFDAFKEDKVRLKLVEGGGVDIGGYRPDCTHVIVDKFVYDDPICIAARNDGKEVVTSLWVDHSCDVAMPVDTTSIMYRPLRDLNGIPGAKSLIVCLTGYLRQDRDDIMTMVGLMGANFSKPLVANKVTHLVCYKFEGEKYELAKKIKKMKLVNHRWLEDCLRAWEILPEADYNKSGYELEMMEAEAKDSDEEIDNMETKQYGDRKVVSPQTLRIEMNIPNKPFVFEQEISKNINSSSAKCLPDLDNTNQMMSATRKDTKPDPASWPQEILSRTLDLPSSHDVGTPCKASGFASNPFDKAPSPEKVGFDFVSGSKITKMTPHSDGSNLTASYSRRTGKASLPMSSGQKQESNVGSPTLNRGKLKVTDGFSISPSSLGPDETTSSCAKTPIQNLSHPGGGQSSTLRGKRKIHLSNDSPKLQKMCDNVEMISDDPFTVNRMEKLVSSGTHVSHETIKQFSPLKGASFMDNNDVAGRRPSFSDISKTVTPEMKRESNVGALQTSSKEFENSCSVSKVVNVEANGQSVSEHVVPNEGDDTTLSSEAKMTGIKKLSGLVELGLPREGDANSVQKPLKKKMFARKVLDSTSRFSKGNPTSKKCSIDPIKTVFSHDSTTKTVGREGVEEPERLVNSERVEAFHPKDSADTSNISEIRNFVESGNGVSNTAGFMDDETEAPEGEEDFHVALHKKMPDAVEAQHFIDVLPAEELNAPCGAKQTDSHILGEDHLNEAGIENSKCEAEKTVCDNRVETPLVKTVAERLTKGKKRPLTKTKKNNRSNAIKVTSSGDAQNEESKPEENHVKSEKKKEMISSKAALKSKMSAPLKKSKNSLGVEKENRPIGFGGKYANNDEEINVKVASKLKKPLISEMMSTKDNPNLKPVEPIPKIGNEPVWFILSGHKWQRKEFQQVIRLLKGRVCRDSHNWSYQATHLIVPDPIRRTEKLFAAAASGRWILQTDYLTASNEAGKFLTEQPYEWYKNGLSQDGAINLEAPRKWRLLRERTGHGAFYGMRVIVYGECLAPPLDTLKRAVKAGDGTILATSPPYTRFLQSGIDFAVVSPGMPRVDMWVQEFIRHEIPCVLADYLVEYVCKPGYSLDKHVQYGTHAWANKSLKNLMDHMEEVIEDPSTPEEYINSDTLCQVCGSRDRGEVMLICGNQSGSLGCGIGTHIDCCDPPLDEVPQEDWFCPKCRKTKGGTNNQPCSQKRKSKSQGK